LTAYPHSAKPTLPVQAPHNLPHKIAHRRTLRANLTAAEAVLWNQLKSSQLQGRKFRRQHSVGEYILDFYCLEEKLAVELDGAGHSNVIGEAHDATRTAYLARFGIVVLRFENKAVWSGLDGILVEVERHFRRRIG